MRCDTNTYHEPSVADAAAVEIWVFLHPSGVWTQSLPLPEQPTQLYIYGSSIELCPFLRRRIMSAVASLIVILSLIVLFKFFQTILVCVNFVWDRKISICDQLIYIRQSQFCFFCKEKFNFPAKSYNCFLSLSNHMNRWSDQRTSSLTGQVFETMLYICRFQQLVNCA
jgi:hypothetical protein